MVQSIIGRCGTRTLTSWMPRWVALTGSFERCEQPTGRSRCSSSLQTQSQIGYPKQIVSPGYEIGPRLRPFHPAIATAPQSAHCLHPPKDFFEPFTNALADPVTDAIDGASIQSRNSNPIFARRVRCHLPFPTPGHEFPLVIGFVRSEGCNLGFVQRSEEHTSELQ